MFRTLIASLLLCCATGAFAAEPAAEDAPDAVCPKTEAEQAPSPAAENPKAARRPDATAPVRARSNTGARGTPRWHSLLPGMFR